MTVKVSQAYAKSQQVNPTCFLTDGETPETARARIMTIVTEVVQRGLSMRDGKMHFGVSTQDMADAKTALGLLKDEDANYMRHSNDSLMNAMGGFLMEFQMAFTPPEKSYEDFNPSKKLPQIDRWLQKLYKCGFDRDIKLAILNP